MIEVSEEFYPPLDRQARPKVYYVMELFLSRVQSLQQRSVKQLAVTSLTNAALTTDLACIAYTRLNLGSC